MNSTCAAYLSRLIPLVLFAFLCTDVFAQQARLRGLVVDADGDPIQGVNIALLSDGTLVTGTITDGDGTFLITSVTAGSYTLRASFIGYETYTTPLELVRASFESLTIELSDASAEIEELVVEAERAGGATVVAGVQTIVPADIDRLPVPGVSGDLISVLQATPSVVSSGDRGGQLFIRGGEPTQNLILIDGIQLYQPFHILGFYSSFPSEIVNTASVYAGGFGSEFGGRISSVIDIASRHGSKSRFSGSVSASPFLSTAHIEGPLIRDKVSILASIRESLVSTLIPDLYGQKLPYKFGDQFLKMHIQPSPDVSLSATVLNSHDEGDVAGTRLTILGDIDNTAAVDTTIIKWNNFGVGTTLSLLPTHIPLESSTSVSFSTYDTELGQLNDPSRKADVEGISIRQDLAYSGTPGGISAGFFYNKTDLSYSLSSAFQDVPDTDTTSVTEAGGYGNISIGVTHGATLDLGTRVHSYTSQERVYVEPRLKFTLPLEIRDTQNGFSFSAGLYHQGIVGLSDERDAGNVFTVWTAVPEESSLPRAIHTIAGWNITARPDHQTIVRASVEGYYKKLDHLSVPVWDSFPQFTTQLQQAKGVSKGIDARFEFTRQTFYGYIGVSRSFTEYRAEDGQLFGSFYGEDQDVYTPPHHRKYQVNAVGRLDIGEVTLTAQFQFGSGLPFTQAVGFDDWLLIDDGIDPLSDPGQARVLYETPYSSQLPDYHRLDLWLERKIESGRVNGMIRAGVVNAYNRANLFYFDLFTLNRIEQLPAVPSIGAKFSF